MYIKSRLEAVCAENRISMSIPPVSYCTDNGVMIAWNGCEKLLSTSQSEEAVIQTRQQDAVFFEGLRPIGKCKLGTDISSQIKLLQIKN
jgi:tRNA A37 threonylcarbamoyltransferase TsaD